MRWVCRLAPEWELWQRGQVNRAAGAVKTAKPNDLTEIMDDRDGRDGTTGAANPDTWHVSSPA